MSTLSDQEVLDVIESAIMLLGTANGTTLRGESTLQAARKTLTALMLQLGSGSDRHDQLKMVDPDPSTLQ